MVKIIPAVKDLKIDKGFLKSKTIFFENLNCDKRIVAALSKLPFDKAGAKLSVFVNGNCGEGYELFIVEDEIKITAESDAGAFYAVQTLRQLFMEDKVPCLQIKDKPDFAYRGFYHDVTRGKVPTVETLKKLIDQMAYYKLNSLQLYVEHTYEFEEYDDLIQKTGYLTSDEFKELDAYCKQNFIDFIPSLATFGHLYELLNQEKYKDLRVLKEHKGGLNFWMERMLHHTLDPMHPKSIEVVKSLISQYMPNFSSEYFNICCDETFDLHSLEGADVGKLYIDFVSQIIDFVKQNGKKVMMWADILLQHPETIDILPEDTYFLNWDYSHAPSEEKIMKFAKLGRKQIVCPGTTSWSRLCENVAVEELNISLSAEYGLKHGAVGLLNTNWGDWGNPCSIELAMYGMVLGAEKAWSVSTQIDDDFYARINAVLYENENGIQYLKAVSSLIDCIHWTNFVENYFDYRFNEGKAHRLDLIMDLAETQQMYKQLKENLNAEKWANDEYREEMILSAEGACLMAELSRKMAHEPCERVTDTNEWLKKFSNKWLKKNKPSELYKIAEIFTYLEEN